MYNPYQNFLNQTQQGQFQNNQFQPQVVTPIVQKTEIVQVNGLDGAKAFQLTPNSSIILLDTSQPVVFIKTTDGAGYPSINQYNLIPFEDKRKETDTTVDEEILERLKQLEERVEVLSNESITKPNGNTRKRGSGVAGTDTTSGTST